MTTVENKIPNVSNLVKKTDYNRKITEIGNKIIDQNHEKDTTTLEFNKLTTENVKARLKQADLVIKTEYDTKLQDISKRITSNKSKHFLVGNELKNCKNLIQVVLEAKIIFVMIVFKII